MTATAIREIAIYLSAVVDAGHDLKTAWVPGLAVLPQVQQAMRAAREKETARRAAEGIEMPAVDDFAQWGIWHEAALIVSAEVGRAAKRLQEDANAEYPAGLPLGDWSHAGLMSAMAAA
ncbi:hypothetical protein LJR039_004308 [Pseudorhodoferax sp. LjRoot39]|uniref:hypothetical protein n=1 Tax=Pseudorhodoferax sp. LjRoot39 TaxID=3342328 RepID=UPI003ECD82D2